MAEITLSRCPFCGARGVKQFEPLVVDGLPRDVPYCGKCGKNYPTDRPKQEVEVLAAERVKGLK